jgi:hypothetical protein
VSNNDSGLGLSVILFVVFLTLKLTDQIDWSWWWVTSPLWISFAIFLGAVLAGVVLGSLVALLYALTPAGRRRRAYRKQRRRHLSDPNRRYLDL